MLPYDEKSTYCPHSVLTKDALSGEVYCIKCGEVIDEEDEDDDETA